MPDGLHAGTHGKIEINPRRVLEMHKSSLDKMLRFRSDYLDEKKNEKLLILDLGSLDVNGSYREYFDIFSWTYLGMDMSPGKNVDVVLNDPYYWKDIKSDTVDVLISGQAFEHIEYFWISMLEIARVLKPGGLCCIIAPSGGPEHRYPVDCWRFYPDGFSVMARFARLDVVEVSTDWKPEVRKEDMSSVWKDTMLVCKKPRLSFMTTCLWQVRRLFLHRILTICL